MNNLFLTGQIGIGKSTLLKNILERLNLSIGGYITEKLIKNNTKTFIVRSLYDCVEKYPIATIDFSKMSKKIFMDSFDTGMVSILDKSLKNRDVIVLDELGFMENNIDKFTSKVYELLDSDKLVLGVLKNHDCEFLNNIRKRDDVTIIEVTKENRDYLLDDILAFLRSFNIPLKETNRFMWHPKKIQLYNKALEHPKNTYPSVFIDEIKKYVGDLNNKTVLDIGAGTGAFAIPLMKEGAKITAIDSSINMTYSLIKRANSHNLKNINCIISPFDSSYPEKHDIAISAFSGGSTKELKSIQKMHNLVNEYSFIISFFGEPHDTFKSDILYKMLDRPPHKKRVHKGTLENTLEKLNYLGYNYQYKELEYNLSQYFTDLNDGLNFFTNRFNIVDDKEVEITKKFLHNFLIEKNGKFVFENIRKSWMVIIKK